MSHRPTRRAHAPDSSFLDLPIAVGALALGVALFAHARRSLFAHALGVMLIVVGSAGLVRLGLRVQATGGADGEDRASGRERSSSDDGHTPGHGDDPDRDATPDEPVIVIPPASSELDRESISEP